MKKIKFFVNTLIGDSEFYSNLVASFIGQNDSNKNFGLETNMQDMSIEIKFNYDIKTGLANPSNWTIINENNVKTFIRARQEFKSEL